MSANGQNYKEFDAAYKVKVWRLRCSKNLSNSLGTTSDRHHFFSRLFHSTSAELAFDV